MWFLDRFKRKRDDGAMRSNDPSLPLASILIRSMDRPTLQRALRNAARQSHGNVEIVVVAACGRRHKPLPEHVLGRPVRLVLPEPDRRLPRPDAANTCLEADLARAEALLVKATKRLPKHAGLRENLAAIRAARNES